MRVKKLNRPFLAGLGLSFLLAFSGSANLLQAQEISDAHIGAARAAIAAIKATNQFDSFISDMSFELKNELMRKDPNLESVISETVEEEAIKLASRRADLEKEVALAYARHFTQEELTNIANFYASEAGKKLLQQGPTAMNDTLAAFDIWRQGLAQDLSVNVARALSQKMAQAAPEVEQNSE